MKRSTVVVVVLAVLALLVGRFALAIDANEVSGNNDAITIPADQTLGDNTSVFHDGVRTRCGGHDKTATYQEGDQLDQLVNEHVLLNPGPNMGTQAELARAVEVVLQMNNVTVGDKLQPGQITLPQWCASQTVT